MKKIITVIITLLLLCGCRTNKTEEISVFSINSYKIDMSAYSGLSYNNHQFLGTTVKELERCIELKGSCAFVLTRNNCEGCNLLLKYLNEAAKELDVIVYVIDGSSKKYPIIDTDDYDLLDSLLKPIEEELDGEITLQTPHFFTVINGEFKDSKVGGTFKDSDNPTDKELNNMYKYYKNALKVFSK